MQFDQMIDDAASRFGLGAKAGPLLRELLQYIMDSPGGIGGLINKFKSAGLAREVTAWLGNGNAAALSPTQVEQALGNNAIDAIAQKVGLSGSAASAAIGYLMPKLVGQLTPNGVIGSTIPSAVSDFLHGAMPGGIPRPDVSVPRPNVNIPRPDLSMPTMSTQPARWIAPLVALLLAGGLGWYFLGNHGPEAVQTSSNGAVPSRLAITNDNGTITFSGTVRDESTRNAIMDALKGVYGSNALKGNITVDPNATPTPWLANLRNGLEQLKTPGINATFDGSSLNLGGSLSDAERARILGALKSVFGAGLTLAAADRFSSLISDSTNKVAAALASLRPGFKTGDLLDILNKSIINFPSGSAEIPPMSMALLRDAAGPLKQLSAGTVIEIGGHTDNTGDANANLQLSQRRAEAVRNALVQAGVKPDMLVAKGYGSTRQVASDDTAEGRFQNRRIEYQLLPQQSRDSSSDK
jgi:outer membrane protein OmpA-like peptidoglycan-associated protein/uncharacterized protein YidB (DUF937 family)